MDLEDGSLFPADVKLYFTDAATNQAAFVPVRLKKLMQESKTYQNFASDTAAPISEWRLLEHVAVSRASVEQFASILNREALPTQQQADALFQRGDLPPCERVVHWNAAAIATYLDCPAIHGFYIWAFSRAYARHGRAWFVLSALDCDQPLLAAAPQGTKRKRDLAGDDTEDENDPKRARLKAPAAAVAAACRACGRAAQGTCAECHAVSVCSAACLALVHGECLGMRIVPGTSSSTVVQLLSAIEPRTRHAIEHLVAVPPLANAERVSSRTYTRLATVTWAADKTAKSDFDDVVAFLISGNSDTLTLTAYLAAASGLGYESAVRELLRFSRVDPFDDASFALRVAFKNKHWPVVSLLLEGMRAVDSQVPDANGLFLLACEHGHTEMAKSLLNDARVDPALFKSSALSAAARNGHADIVAMLLADARVDPTAQSNLALRSACRHGRTDVVRMLLADERIEEVGDALYDAATMNRGDTVRLILADARTTPADIEMALFAATDAGQTAAVAVLLADPRSAVITEEGSSLLADAAREGHADTVALFLNDPRVDIAAEGPEALEAACDKDRTAVVELLLKDPRIDPSARSRNILDNVVSLSDAYDSSYVNMYMLDLLLADPRVNPTDGLESRPDFLRRKASRILVQERKKRDLLTKQ
jgi:ankyrin repeat protein